MIQLLPDADPASIEAAVVAAERAPRLQFDVPLPDAVLAAVAEVLRRHPDVELRASGYDVDPGLGWLAGLEHVEHLIVDLWHETSFDPLAACTRLRSLRLGCPHLNKLVAGDTYPEDQRQALRSHFTGATLWMRGDGDVRGELSDVLVRWRAPVDGLLAHDQ